MLLGLDADDVGGIHAFCPAYSVAMWAPFSATERLTSSMRIASPRPWAPDTQKTSKEQPRGRRESGKGDQGLRPQVLEHLRRGQVLQEQPTAIAEAVRLAGKARVDHLPRNTREPARTWSQALPAECRNLTDVPGQGAR